jgi:D-3-phosphoglycerate dehydrogenase
LDSIDLNAAARHGVTISDCAGATTEPVAELTVGLMISLLRKINSMNHLMHQGKWEQKHGELLQGKTVGIVGMGRIGRRVASLLRSFDCQILGCDLNPDREWFNGTKTPLVSPEEIWTKADIISIHVYLAPENVHMLGEKEFSMMKSGVYFLNLSRGPVVDEKALIKFLNKGNFSGVALDVFENEPYQGQLSSFENVILLPHVGASTEESRKQMELGAIEHLLKLLA